MKKRWLGWLTALLCFVGATASAACTHENAVRVSASSYNASYENTGDVRFHKVRKRTRTELFCPDCLKTWDSQEDEPTEALERHSFKIENDCYICRRCGFFTNAIACKHEHTEKQTYYEHIVTEYVDTTHHALYKADRYESIYCNDCRHTLSSKLIRAGKDPLPRLEKHTFDHGVCSCGYANPCKHQHVETTDIFTHHERYVRQPDEKHHIKLYRVQKFKFCADCEEILSQTGVFSLSRQYQPHNFGADGLCRSCGYMNHCHHKQTKHIREFVGFDPLILATALDDVHHEINSAIADVIVCADCGQTLTDNGDHNIHVISFHDHKDHCSLCGWTTPAHVCTWVPIQGENNQRIIYSASPVDGLTHRIVFKQNNEQCSGCGIYRFNGAASTQEVVENHHFTRLGRCEDCGYVNSCTHPQTRQADEYLYRHDYEAQSAQQRTVRTLPQDYHSFHAVHQSTTYCALCGQTLEITTLPDVECAEAHTFDDDGRSICSLCGYEQEPATPQPTESSKQTPSPEQLLPKTGDASLSPGRLLLALAFSAGGVALLFRRRRG